MKTSRFRIQVDCANSAYDSYEELAIILRKLCADIESAQGDFETEDEFTISNDGGERVGELLRWNLFTGPEAIDKLRAEVEKIPKGLNIPPVPVEIKE
jgi:hypothetical protein